MSSRSRAYYVRAAKRFRERRYLLVKGILPQTILSYLKVYYAILLANKRFGNDDQCPYGSLLVARRFEQR